EGGAALRRLLGALYAGHPYAPPLLGTPESLGQLSAPALRALHRRHYLLPQLTMVVAGDVSAEAVASGLHGRLGGAPGSKKEKDTSVLLSRSRGPRVTFAEGPATEVLLGVAIPPAKGAELPAFEAAAALLGDGALLLQGREPGVLGLSVSADSAIDAARA